MSAFHAARQQGNPTLPHPIRQARSLVYGLIALAILAVLFLNLKAAHSEERMWFQGMASTYGYKDGFDGRPAACGGTYRQWGLTAASRDIPCWSIVQVCNLANQKCVTLTITDYGPARKTGRILDVSTAGATILDFRHAGVAKVDVQVLYRPH